MENSQAATQPFEPAELATGDDRAVTGVAQPVTSEAQPVTGAEPLPAHSRRSAGHAGGAGRYAPSPSGDLHLGNLRTALLAWAYARTSGRRFLLRSEDLDERARPEHEASQLRDLEAIGIDWDGQLVRQSERQALYRAKEVELAAAGLLYECYCTRRELAQVASAPHRPPGAYPGTCRNLSESERVAGRAKLARIGRAPALRLRAAVTEENFTDANYGAYRGAVDDLVIRRGDGVYSYNFVSVVDDGEMGVDQIVRGDDLIPSTPRQVYLQKLLGYRRPEYRHVPLALNEQGARLAKRDGAVTLARLRALGLNTADVLEMIAQSLGYPGIRTASEFLQEFDPSRLAAPESAARAPWIVTGLPA